ncbi:MAG: hypothetical protein QM662_06605 [Gordonia sp. (in: high G+C Gram-positive bacteria)]
MTHGPENADPMDAPTDVYADAPAAGYDPGPAQPAEDAPAPPAGPGESRSSVSWPTVLASAGIAAVISALIVTVGVVGLWVIDQDRDGLRNTAAQPTVVNLGGAQGAPNGQVPVSTAATPGASRAAAPTERVPADDSPGGVAADDSAGGVVADDSAGDVAPGAAAATPQAQAGAAAVTTSQAATPAALSPAQLTTKVKLVMNTSASRSARAAELEGGARALTNIDAVARLLAAYPNSGFTYRVIGPVSVSGTGMNATLQMSRPGQGSRTKTLSWVWMDNKWKLTNQSVCAVTAYTMMPCSVA